MESAMASSHLTDKKDYLRRWIDATSPEPELKIFNSDAQNSESSGCLTLRFYACCLRILHQICQQFSAVDPLELQRSGLEDQARLAHEELGRLYLCGDSFQGEEIGQALEHAVELRNGILEVFCGIGSLITRGVSQIARKGIQNLWVIKDQDLEDLSFFIEQSKIHSSGNSDDEEAYDNDNDDDNSSDLSDDYDLGIDLRSRVQMILDLIPALEATMEHQKIIRYKSWDTTKPKFCASGPAQFYISLIHDKFPKANQRLKERLGEANWQRHLNIRNRMDQIANHPDQEPALFAVVNEKGSISASVFQPKTMAHDSGIGTTVGANSQYAGTEASHTSFISSIAQQEKGTLRVPPTPVEVGTSKPFNCHLCGFRQTKIKNRVDWKRHVFQDLLPYICTFPSCKDDIRQFATRQAWAEHEFNEHRLLELWECPHCPQEYRHFREWTDHLRKRHSPAHSDSQISTMMRAAQKKNLGPIDEQKCFLCNTQPSISKRALIAHIGKHMEEIALMALPRNDEDETGTASDSNDDIKRSDKHLVSSVKDVHDKSSHDVKRSYICMFARYGCPSSFSSKTTWKRHVSSQHLRLGVWKCDIGTCVPLRSPREIGLEDWNIFNRKDLFTQHVRRMHGPSSSAPKAEKEAFENTLGNIRERCWRRLHPPPQHSLCGFCLHSGGKTVFVGESGLEERMEHIGRHLEAGDQEEDEDVELKKWMVHEKLMWLEGGQWRVVGIPEGKQSGGKREKDIERAAEAEKDAEGDDEGYYES